MGAAWADPPGRVGRIGLLEGTVSFHTGDQQDWSPASLNYPVTVGNSFWTEPDAKLELQIGGATVRLRPSTEFDVTALDEESFQGQIGQGSINLHVRDFGPDQYYQIVTAHGTVQITQPGRYHIDAGSADGSQPTLVEVIEGSAEFVGPNTDVTVTPGQSATITGADKLAYQVSTAAPDEFDHWAEQRDQQRTFVASAQYVSPDMPGAEDLDQNGTWQPADAGPVWVPHNMPADWAPYRYGHWGYVDPWGWTWIDDASWGFAPFHYGRWVQTGGGWGWTPGAIDAHPYYAPALVAFIGGPPAPPGPGVSIGFGVAIGGIVGAVGWVPLGPQEVYRPPYRVSDTYMRNVNISNVRNVTVINNTVINNVTVNNYANARAATVVKADAMTGSRPIGRAVVAVTPAQLARAPIAQAGPVGIRPTATTVGATPMAIKAAGGTPPTAAAQHHAPGPLGAGGHPVTAVQLTHVEPPKPAARPVAPARLTPAAAAAFHPPAPSNAPARPVAEPKAEPAGKPGAPPTEAGKPGTPGQHEAPANAGHPPTAQEHGIPPAIAPEPHPAARPEPATPAKPAPAPEATGRAPTPATQEHAAPPAITPEPHPAARPEPARPEPAAKPEPQAAKPEPAARPEPPKPEPARPEPAARPEPQAAKPEPAARPEPAKPEPARPEPAAKPAPAPVAHPEPRPEPAPAARPEPPKPEPAAHPEPKPEPPKAAPPPPKPAPKPEPKKPEEEKKPE